MPFNGKLIAMSQATESKLQTAGLLISTATGEVNHIDDQLGAIVRLSPVNKRVLLTLLQQAGKVISRQHLFEAVWPNQVISDDALTRCISDLRSQLKTLSKTEPLIETIPKTGYRWLPAVEAVSTHKQASKRQNNTAWLAQLKPLSIALGLSLILLWGLIGLLYWWSKPSVIPLVILPTEQTGIEVAETIDVAELLKISTRNHTDLQYLSQYAIQSHQGSPFPYFSHEFGVRWFIESHLITTHDKTQLSLNLIDAKTALVIYSSTKQIDAPADIKTQCLNFIDFVAEL